MAAIVAPTVNSYKRLVPGYEAPVYICWAQINRSALIRIPRYTAGQHKATRAELRFPDPSANPYLAFTAMLIAGLDGIDKHIPCPPPLNNVNVYELNHEEREEMGIGELPGSLYEALQELDRDEVIKGAFDPTLYQAYRRAKLTEWMNSVSRLPTGNWHASWKLLRISSPILLRQLRVRRICTPSIVFFYSLPPGINL